MKNNKDKVLLTMLALSLFALIGTEYIVLHTVKQNKEIFQQFLENETINTCALLEPEILYLPENEPEHNVPEDNYVSEDFEESNFQPSESTSNEDLVKEQNTQADSDNETSPEDSLPEPDYTDETDEVLKRETVDPDTPENKPQSNDSEQKAEDSDRDNRQSYNGLSEGETITGTATYYDACVQCCGDSDGITAYGLVIQNGVAPDVGIVSCNWLPLGTSLTIDGEEYLVADRGGGDLDEIGRVDIFTPEGHDVALNLGRKEGIEITITDLP